jgi:hypothetical protein
VEDDADGEGREGQRCLRIDAGVQSPLPLTPPFVSTRLWFSSYWWMRAGCPSITCPATPIALHADLHRFAACLHRHTDRFVTRAGY